MTNADLNNLPLFMKSKDIRKEIIGLDVMGENIFYKLVNLPDCPKIKCGRTYVYPTLKFYEWFKSLSSIE